VEEIQATHHAANNGLEIKRSRTSDRHLKYSADDLQNKIQNVLLKQRKTL
jgi:hypothetical protein